MGYSVSQVEEITELSEKEVEKLKTKMEIKWKIYKIKALEK